MTKTPGRKLFVNLAVSDLQRSVAFYAKLGFRFDPRFTDESATCMIVSDEAFVMLLVKDRFRDFTRKALCDTASHNEALLAFSLESREAVDAVVRDALATGGTPACEPQDHGFMYQWSFQDPDGHHWEPFWMDPQALA